MKPPFSPAKPTKNKPVKPYIPINPDEISRAPQQFIESAAQSLGLKPDSPAAPPPTQVQEQQDAADQIATQQKLATIRSNIQQIETEIAEHAQKRQEDRATSRLNQDQPPAPPQPEEENAVTNPPSAPKKHLFPGQIAAAKRKATQRETRTKVAGS
jgi:hypothetical protein